MFIHKYFLLWKNQNIEKNTHKVTIIGKNNPKKEIGQNKFGLINGDITDENKLTIATKLRMKMIL